MASQETWRRRMIRTLLNAVSHDGPLLLIDNMTVLPDGSWVFYEEVLSDSERERVQRAYDSLVQMLAAKCLPMAANGGVVSDAGYEHLAAALKAEDLPDPEAEDSDDLGDVEEAVVDAPEPEIPDQEDPAEPVEESLLDGSEVEIDLSETGAGTEADEPEPLPETDANGLIDILKDRFAKPEHGPRAPQPEGAPDAVLRGL